MAWARPRQAATSARWSCKRCYTVNPMGAQFCSDCGLAPQGGTVAAAPAIDVARGRLVAVPVALVAVATLALVGMQLIH